MFIINLTYQVSLETVDRFLEEHICYLEEQYKTGNFMASGRKEPRTGGIILAKGENRKDVEQMIEKDPFKKHGVAHYEIIEFTPSKTSEELTFLLN
ncbi:YciI family protein [Tenacibaculum xiamenense]|uniref:YciI family protein n=1 Tax=Tenacibaculum xiamenense TaxID=1261553 RepID=UPI0038930178